MAQSLKKYLWSWVFVVVLSVLLIVFAKTGGFESHRQLAQDPTNIEKITKLDLPDIISVESWDNLVRGTSCWDCFEHRSLFAEKLSDDCVRQLESLCEKDSIHWHKNEEAGFYEYLDDAWNRGGAYCICCRIYEDYSFVEYYVDEVEGVYTALLGLLVLFVAVVVLFIWGIVLLVIRICRKYKRCA